MLVNAYAQLYAFLMLFCGGAVSGMAWDLFLPLRRRLGRKRLSIGIADFLLWAGWAVGIFLWNLYVNDGEVRWYGIFALISGSVVYFLTFSRLLRPLFVFFFAVIEKIVRLILKIVLTILVFLYKIILYVVMLIKRIAAPFLKLGRRCVSHIGRAAVQVRLVLKKR